MAIQIMIRSSADLPSVANVDMTPDRCPLCHFSITPIPWMSGVRRANGQVLERLLQCPNETCQCLFLAQYALSGQQYAFRGCVPSEIRTLAQTKTIQMISDDFCKIYDESHKAEQLNLKLVAGPGFRKALEFLVKDYVISGFAEKDSDVANTQKTAVERMPLAACIEKYVKSEQIKQIAKRAAWLGNDETHYVRKWESKDLEDLKKLITLTLHWIEMEKLTRDVIDDMPEAKPKSAA
jgi:hypothetical protein